VIEERDSLERNFMNKSPHEIAEDILKIADFYGKLGERLNDLNKLYALWWQTCRTDYKSDKSAEKSWDLTKEGTEMQEVRLKIKVMEKKMSAYKTYLRVLEGEARNMY
jgi:hypothetical protein